jgi:hypothetical protein
MAAHAYFAFDVPSSPPEIANKARHPHTSPMNQERGVKSISPRSKESRPGIVCPMRTRKKSILPAQASMLEINPTNAKSLFMVSLVGP